MARRLILIAGLGLILASRVAAQGGDRPGVVGGVVFDSLITSAPLEGAEVWIESTNRMARSDAGGTTDVALATPSPAEAHRLLCPRDPFRRTGSVVGIVHNAADGKPIGAAT